MKWALKGDKIKHDHALNSYHLPCEICQSSIPFLPLSERRLHTCDEVAKAISEEKLIFVIEIASFVAAVVSLVFLGNDFKSSFGISQLRSIDSKTKAYLTIMLFIALLLFCLFIVLRFVLDYFIFHR
jgi:hypothetical protein